MAARKCAWRIILQVTFLGIRDTARVLQISPTTVIEALKKDRHLEPVNKTLLEQMEINSEPVMLVRVEEAEMWSFVQSKQQQRWLWSAIDHHAGLRPSTP